MFSQDFALVAHLIWMWMYISNGERRHDINHIITAISTQCNKNLWFVLAWRAKHTFYLVFLHKQKQYKHVSIIFWWGEMKIVSNKIIKRTRRVIIFFNCLLLYKTHNITVKSYKCNHSRFLFNSLEWIFFWPLNWKKNKKLPNSSYVLE